MVNSSNLRKIRRRTGDAPILLRGFGRNWEDILLGIKLSLGSNCSSSTLDSSLLKLSLNSELLACGGLSLTSIFGDSPVCAVITESKGLIVWNLITRFVK